MYNIAKKYLLLGLSLSLLIVVAVFFFNQKETTAPQIEIATKKQTKLTHIKYEGAVVVAEELDNIDDIIVELDAIQTAGTFSLTAMAQSITAEALKAFSDTDEYSLPLLSHWNVGIPELTDAMNPMYMIGRIEQGEHILVSWKLDPYYADTIGSSYYEESIKKAAELQLPLVFILPAPESALTKDSYYKNLSIEDNPNVIDENNNTLDKLSPFGPDERWNEVGNQWSSTTLMNQLQEWYPNPPLVVFISEDEAAKLSWNEVSIASRYWECYSECSPEMQDDNYKRILLGGKWIEKYRQMQNGFKEGFTESAWKDNVKFISYNNFSDDFGKSADWIDNATVTNQYVNLWPLTADGATINFDLTGTKSDATADSPHILANNLPFMLKEAKSENQNPNFAYQLSIDDDSKIIDPTQYRGLTQFALWFLRPNFIRQKSSGTIRTELEPMFKEVVDSVELIHYNPQVAEFWKNGKLVQNGDSYLNENIPEQYQNDPRWFLLDADVNPPKPWSDDTSIKVWAFALVKGEAPNREWLIYAQSPKGDVIDFTIAIPEYIDVTVSSSINGNFYAIGENAVVEKVASIDSEIPIVTDNTQSITEESILLDNIQQSKSLNSPIEGKGAVYYVDATLGNDNNDGLSQSTAWKTLSKVNSFSYSIGDSVLFKRGETFNGALSYLKKFYGVEGNPNTLGAYGIGEQPILTSITEQILSWTQESGNLYKATVLKDPYRILQNDSEILRADSIAQIDGNRYKWYYDDVLKLLYVYFDGATEDSTISYSTSGTIVLLLTDNYVTIQDLNVQGGSNAVYAYKPSYTTIRNCTIGKYSHNGINISGPSYMVKGTVIENNIVDSEFTFDYTDSTSSYKGHAEGIVLYYDNLDVNISNNLVKNWGHSGINLYSPSGSSIKSTTISDNYITSPDIAYGGSMTITGDISLHVFDNYFIDTAAGIQLNGNNIHFHHNIIANVRNSPLKTTNTGWGISLSSYAADVYSNIIEYNTFIDMSGIAFVISGNMHGGTIKDNIIRRNTYNDNAFDTTDNTTILVYPPYQDDGIQENNQIVDNVIHASGIDKPLKYNDTLYDVVSFEKEIGMLGNRSYDTDPFTSGEDKYRSNHPLIDIDKDYGAFSTITR